MASDQQIAANRRNASKSTGPRTEEGKAAVRLNALTHGLRARTLILPGEDRAGFEQLCRELMEDLQPVGRTEQAFITQMAEAEWRIDRINRAEQILFRRRAFELERDLDLKSYSFTRYRQKMEEQEPAEQIPLQDDLFAETCERESVILETWSRQRARLERSRTRALRELQRLQDRRGRPAPVASQPPQPEASQPENEIAPAPAANSPEIAASQAAPHPPVSPSPATSPQLALSPSAPGSRFVHTPRPQCAEKHPRIPAMVNSGHRSRPSCVSSHLW